MISKRGDKVERARSVKLWCGLLFDFGRIGDIEDGQPGAVVLLTMYRIFPEKSWKSFFISRHLMSSESAHSAK